MSAALHRLREVARRLRGPKGIALAVLGAAGVASGALLLAGGSIAREAAPYLYADVDAVPARYAAIVPGCRVHPDGTPSAMLEDRLAAAADLYAAGKVRRILVSGDHGAPEYDEVAAMRRWLVDRGVPDAVVFQDHAGFRTLDTMARASRVFAVDAAVVCTQGFHLARAVWLARRFGIDAVGLRADRRPYAGAARDGLREAYARGFAFLDARVLGTEARYYGARIPIGGDGRATRDGTR